MVKWCGFVGDLCGLFVGKFRIVFRIMEKCLVGLISDRGLHHPELVSR